MPTIKQHFVPRVYIKRWSPCLNNNVFSYNKSSLAKGEPRNAKKILFKRHIYTVDYNVYFTLDYMPEVQQDFGSSIIKILNEHSACAYYNNLKLDSVNALADSKNLANIDDWIFYRQESLNKLASKKIIVSLIKGVRSYVLEDALDKFVETKWNSILDKFIAEVEKGLIEHNIYEDDADVEVNPKTICEIINTMLLFICRNPMFDCQGAFPKIKKALLDVFLSNETNPDNINGIKQVAEDQMRGAWLSQIYKALYTDDLSFCERYMKSISQKCQVTLLKCDEKNGSFITSDNPAFIYVNLADKVNRNAMYFPLTPQYLLLIGKGSANSLHKLSIKALPNKGIKIINRIVLSKAYDAVISDRKYLGYVL